MGAVVNPAEHMGLVYTIAHKYRKRWDVKELVQEGAIGLTIAAKKFDPKRGVKFSTYATWWIHHHILSFLDDGTRLIHLPVLVHQKLRKAGNLPPLPVSMDQQVTRDFGTFTLHDVIADERAERPDEGAARNELRQRIRTAMSFLKTRTQYVLKRRFVDERTLDEVGRELGVSRERIRQIEERGLEVLRAQLEACREFMH